MRRVAYAVMLISAFGATVACRRTALSESDALEQIRAHESFTALREGIKVIGITEGDAERIVKIDHHGSVANVKFRRYNTGWVAEQIEAPRGWVDHLWHVRIEAGDLQAGLDQLDDRIAQQLEAGAVSVLRAVQSGQAAYASSCGGGFFASTLAVLTTPPRGERTAFLGDDLRPPSGSESVEYKRYRFSLEAKPSPEAPASCNGSPAGAGARDFLAKAAPVSGFPGRPLQVDSRGQFTPPLTSFR